MDEFKDKYIGFIEKFVNFFGQKELLNYIEIARNPIDKIKTLNTCVSMAITLFILTFIFEVIPGIIALAVSYGSNYLTTQYVPTILEIGLIGGLVLLSGVLMILVLGIYSLIEFLFAKLLGGIGDLKGHVRTTFGSYLTAYVLSMPLLIISAILSIMQVIPLLNIIICLLFLPIFVVGIIELIIGFYGVYIKWVMIKELHKLDTLKAILVLISPHIILLILGLIVIAIVLALGISAASLGIAGLN